MRSDGVHGAGGANIMGDQPKTIGVLISCPHEPYQARIQDALARCARERGIALISFVGTSQDNVDTLVNHYAIVGDFIARAAIDGLVCFGGAIENHRGTEYAEELYRRFKGIPTVLISSATAGLPSVLVENFSGVEAIVDHLVKVHGRRRIAFIKGPEGAIEAEERFAGYRWGLEKNGIPFDDSLVRPGGFLREDGIRGVRDLLDADVSVDAVVGADDFTALGAIEELRRCGYHVPTDMAVAGFDDESIASVTYPPLTTVSQPWLRLGEATLDTLDRLMAGETVENKIGLRTQIVLRRSCGCFPEAVHELAVPLAGEPSDARKIIFDATSGILAMAAASGSVQLDSAAIHRAGEQLAEAFLSTTTGVARSGFLDRLDMLFNLVEPLQGSTDLLADMLSELLARVGDFFTRVRDLNQATSLLQQGQSLLREYKLISLQAFRIRNDEFQDRIRESCQQIITTFVQEDLLTLMADKFPGLAIRRCAFAIYDVPGRTLTSENWEFPESSRLLLCCDAQRNLRTILPEDSAFATSDIIPEELRKGDPANWIMMPVFFKSEHFGFIVFEHEPGNPPFMYEELRSHIGSAIKSASMMDELKIQSMVDELTGVQNRRGFMSRGRKLLDAARSAGKGTLVFYADLDKLKTINDTFGHEEGDAAIAAAADILKHTFRRNDVIGRIGGDEFCVILAVDNATEPGEAIQQRLRAHMRATNERMGKPYEISLSVGMSRFEPDHNKSLDAILKEADERLLEKKRARKNAERNALNH